jgi:hypothetical protein
MSETTSEACESPISLPCLRPGAEGSPADLLSLCDRIVKWSVTFGTMTNPVTWAEANGMPDVVVDAATEQEEQVLLEIMDLATTLADIHAANQLEIEGKQRALNALTNNQSWERDSLYELRLSIERDQAEVNALLFASSQSQAQRPGWLNRFNPAIAKG